jgi:polyisoprenoid-binding protein YceI
MRRHWKRWLLVGVVVLVVGVVGGPYVYIHFLTDKAPARLAVTAASAAPVETSGPVVATNGRWTVIAGSTAGYRVREVLFGQSKEAAGRTDQVTGNLAIAGSKVTKASFTVDMASVTSDQSRRDGQFRGRIMDTSTYPTSSFVLTAPIDLGTVPPVGSSVTRKATGTLTLHGTSKDVTIDVTARRGSSSFVVNGEIPIVFAEWNIPNPSGGPASTEDHGVLEFLLKFAKA